MIIVLHRETQPGQRHAKNTSHLEGLRQREADVSWEECDDVARTAAARLAVGKVCGWFQGRSEFGARALGNRSILADPRRKDMKDRINALVKGREAFRPFAPSVLLEEAHRFFELRDESPYMNLNSRVLDPQLLPAVTHVDGSARVQTVRRENNPRYHRLIESFAALADGLPVLLNTSFNEHEPIVERPIEAIGCFLRTNIDELFLGDFRVLRR